MTKNRLNVNYVEHKSSEPSFTPPSKSARRQETQAKMERLWLQDPQQFNPERDCMQRQRLKRTIETLTHRMPLEGKLVADLGCGAGVFSRRLRDAGAKVEALDVAANALEYLKAADAHNITPIQDCLPVTRLNDNVYDVVVCTEVIGYLHQNEYRLLFAELSRLVKSDGLVVCATSFDIDTEDPLERFSALGETEFIIDQWVLGYHRLLIQICRFFEAPQTFIRGSRDADWRYRQIQKRTYFSRWWFIFNTTALMALFWKMVNWIARPLAAGFRQSTGIMNFLERICKFFWSQSGITHALFIGRRRPLTFPLPPQEIPREMKHKRQVWE